MPFLSVEKFYKLTDAIDRATQGHFIASPEIRAWSATKRLHPGSIQISQCMGNVPISQATGMKSAGKVTFGLFTAWERAECPLTSAIKPLFIV